MKSLIEHIKKQPAATPFSTGPKRKPRQSKGKSEIKEKSTVKKGKPYKKQKISQALREQVWIQHNGRVFQAKCMVTWCKNKISVFDFQCGHDIPESKGGPTNISNLYPICGKCNLSMSNTYTFKEWCKLYEAKEEENPSIQHHTVEVPPKKSFWKRLCGCFMR